ncbi:hypothetical protein PZ938_10165 [Luteipulveratus sp. YIM 133132]|uniref:hypothetical protein n=1 Tax=Luteipulveratus flavus TaxID=3031728 RepID=UPI0023AE8BD0|nr:hypothetical protein [Luteipulveratus sp. YIM 133132]MDE9365967.1 hypothetical protein [Luteipulveratus sp. YIM 133132]
MATGDRTPFSVHSPTNAWGPTVYVGAVLLALVHLLDVQRASYLANMIGEPAYDLWCALFLLGSVNALWSALWSTRENNPSRELTREAWSALAIGLLSLLYLISIVKLHGVWTTKDLVQILVTGGIARFFQARSDVKKLRRAQAQHLPANPAPLADPDSTQK